MTSASERGSATVLALALVPVLLLGGFILAGITQLMLLRQQLATAADLSAIAAAQSPAEACSRARMVADAHGVHLIACAAIGADWRVEVSAPIDSVAMQLIALAGRGPRELREIAVAGYQ
jgi:secretion/DNA translocation related TadE-like protein